MLWAESDGDGWIGVSAGKEAVAADIFRLQLNVLVKLVEARGSGKMPPCAVGRRTCGVILLIASLCNTAFFSVFFFIYRHDADTHVVTRLSLDRRYQREVI